MDCTGSGSAASPSQENNSQFRASIIKTKAVLKDR